MTICAYSIISNIRDSIGNDKIFAAKHCLLTFYINFKSIGNVLQKRLQRKKIAISIFLPILFTNSYYCEL